MKTYRFLPFALLSILLLVMTIDASAKARVFLLAGQSNMAGAGIYNELKGSEKTPQERVKIWAGNQWQLMGDVASAGKGTFGPEIAFGRAMSEAFPEDNIYLIKTAAGGTSMHMHWKADKKRGMMLNRFLSRANKAFKNLDENRIKYTVDGMLWMQGEADADQGKGAEYEASLREFITEMRREFKEQEMPFLMGRILPTFDRPKGNGPLVREAQTKVAKEMKKVACFDTDKFDRINKGHYNHKGQIQLGKTFAEHLLEMMKKK